MADTSYGIPEAFVFCQDNVKVTDKIVYMPLYMLMFLQHQQPNGAILPFDLAGLA